MDKVKDFLLGVLIVAMCVVAVPVALCAIGAVLLLCVGGLAVGCAFGCAAFGWSAVMAVCGVKPAKALK